MNLWNNSLVSLPQSIFVPCKLTYLELKLNKLTHLPKHLLHGQQKVEYVNFYRNQLQFLPYDFFFFGLINLQELSLSNNKIKHLSQHIFNGLESLRVLYLSNNQLKTLDFNIFQDTKNLRILVLTGNEFTNVPNIMHLEKLIFLNLRENKLDENNSRWTIINPSKSDRSVSQSTRSL